jgi:hypothetical protein
MLKGATARSHNYGHNYADEGSRVETPGVSGDRVTKSRNQITINSYGFLSCYFLRRGSIYSLRRGWGAKVKLTGTMDEHSLLKRANIGDRVNGLHDGGSPLTDAWSEERTGPGVI